jgi:hypothetical protein
VLQEAGVIGPGERSQEDSMKNEAPVLEVTEQIRTELRRALFVLGGKPSDTTIIESATETNHGAVSRRFEQLGADYHLLAFVGSWGDTQPDEEVLALLTMWNDAETADR